MTDNFKYQAFISYSHANEQRVKKLHQQLERYRFPVAIRQSQRTLTPIFRDKAELTVANDLSLEIKKALQASKALIVVCSPQAAQSRWVNKEILFFKSLGRSDQIFTVIIDGEPFASENGNASLECLPEALRFKTGPKGEHGAKAAEPLAADLRPNGDGKKLGVLKLISALAGVGLDDLVRRDLQRVRQRTIGAFATTSVILVAMGALTLRALTAERNAEFAAQAAQAHKADAEDLIEFMLGDLRDRLEPVGRLDVLDVVGEKAIDYYNQFEPFEMEPETDGRRARTLHLIGEVQDKLGNLQESEQFFQESYQITQRNVVNTDTPHRIFEHARSAYWRSVPLRRAGKPNEELVFINEYESLVSSLVSQDPDNIHYQAELAMAKTHLGRIDSKIGSIEDARRHFEKAARLYESVLDHNEDPAIRLEQARNYAWLADSYRQTSDHQTSYELRQQQTQILETQKLTSPNDRRFSEELIYAQIGLGNAARYLDRNDESIEILAKALESSTEILRREPDREKMCRARVATLIALMTTNLKTQNVQSYHHYRSEIDRMVAKKNPAIMDPKSVFWNTGLPAALEKMDIEFRDKVRKE